MSEDPHWGVEPTRPIPPATSWDEPTKQISQPWQGYPESGSAAPDHRVLPGQPYANAPVPAPSYPTAQPYPSVPPAQYYPVATPPERQSNLGWVSLGMSVVALVLSVVAGVVTIDSWTGTDLDAAATDSAVIESLLRVSVGGLIAQIVATLLGLAGLITGAVSLANRTSRLVGAFGLGLAIAAPMISTLVLTSMLPIS